MNYLLTGLCGLLLASPLGVWAQKARPGAPGSASRTVQRHKSPAAGAGGPTAAPLVVPSWLQSEGPLQPAATVLTEVNNTKLDLRFDYQKQYLLGTAILTLRSHFYPQSQVVLDAKGFDVQKVELVGERKVKPLVYTYDKRQLTLTLDRPYSRTEAYQVRIVYVAKPNELPAGGSAAITAAKGLYFINPLGLEKNKPRQIWTQGETESNSCWFPTIDRPNQRMTQEISLTVENQFKTLSNGSLISSKTNSDGTRTDSWRQSQPQPPYLTSIVVGDYAIVSDVWRGKAVEYYVEPPYAATAKAVFGHTPEMLEFFSKNLGMDYPWDKYAQVAVRDYVSGAMENTTAVTHGTNVQVTRRELLDATYAGNETIIAHELVHHWFGDYVTCESWSNLPLNESFADYGEYLWAEHKYGPEEAALVQETKLASYLDEAQGKREPLIRYHYNEREDMFDRHSYAKGGRVLHMLRKYAGDDAFFASLNRYLVQNKQSAVEISKLRTAFEETTGEDLMWFFDQWFLKRGHPELHISHSYAAGALTLRVQQTQDTVYQPVYRLPVTVTVWQKDRSTDYRITTSKADQTFSFPATERPSLVKFDSEGQLLAQIDEDRTPDELIFQFDHARGYLQRSEVLELLQNKTGELPISALFRGALDDKFWAIRRTALEHLRRYRGPEGSAVRQAVLRVATTDPNSQVRAQALATLASFPDNAYRSTFLAALTDSSYIVAAAALAAVAKIPGSGVQPQVAALDNTSSSVLLLALADYYAQNGALNQYAWFLRRLPDVVEGDLYRYLQAFGALMVNIPPVERDKGQQLLEEYARHASRYDVRLGAYKGLALLMPSTPELKATLQRIREQETDQRLKAFYNLM
ncbi:alanyl aminopeptidase [Hymenobacter coccineus]|uniref:Aminopeptidase N n=1 Tax=Hymenobacter coccineus TaxID=1908235 RepID=A0A1G1TGA0_9BACT|nr:alanyl aminopeptidase [Hymenobacter coccineus]